MAGVLTTASMIKCAHQGTVTVAVAGQSELLADGQAALVLGDLIGAPITGCTAMSKPCTATTSMLVGQAMTVEAGGKPVLLDTATGLTDSVPPGTWSVESAGQTLLEAD